MKQLIPGQLFKLKRKFSAWSNLEKTKGLQHIEAGQVILLLKLEARFYPDIPSEDWVEMTIFYGGKILYTLIPRDKVDRAQYFKPVKTKKL
jgi:hypothetical protein